MAAGLIISGLFNVQSSCNPSKSKATKADSTIATYEEEKWNLVTPDTTWMRNHYTCVEIETNKGKLTIALFDETPAHRDNFLKLVNTGFYNNVLFHRVIKDFMIQTGDPESIGSPAGADLGKGGPGYTQKAEILDTLYHYRGALAAARQGDEINPQKNSSGSQFYIISGSKHGTLALKNVLKNRAAISFMKDPENMSYGMRMETYQRSGDQAKMNTVLNELEVAIKPLTDSLYNSLPERTRQIYATWGGYPALDKEYTIFGFLVSGYSILDAIQMERTNENGRPFSDVRILKTTVLPKGKP